MDHPEVTRVSHVKQKAEEGLVDNMVIRWTVRLLSQLWNAVNSSGGLGTTRLMSAGRIPEMYM